MPNRILKESICTSDNLNGLSQAAEVFFYRLLVQCDDYGRFDARPPIIQARCFPLRHVEADELQSWIMELVEHELIEMYEVDEKRYLHVINWEKHQTIRAKRSKYPPMPEKDTPLQASASICKQMHAYVPVIQSNPIQSESESNPIKTQSAHGAPTTSEAVRIFLEKGGKFPAGKLGDGTRKADKAMDIITEQVRSTPESLEFWGKVVEAYCLVWSPKSYTVMLNEYYLRQRVPGQSGNVNGRTPSSAKPRNGYNPNPNNLSQAQLDAIKKELREKNGLSNVG